MRSLLKSPGFAIYAILSLALGIGANTALFSVYDQLILKPLPASQIDPSRLVLFHSEGPNTGSFGSDNFETVFSYPMFADLSKQLTSFDALFARAGSQVSFAGLGQAELASVDLVSGTFFPALGLHPAAGRLFTPNDDVKDSAHPVVVLAHGYWTEHFGGRPDVVGQKVLVNNQPMEIVGIAPAGFEGVVRGQKPDLYLTLHMKPAISPGPSPTPNRRSAWMNIFGLLKPGVTREQAATAAAPAYRAILEDELHAMKRQTDKFKRGFVDKKLEILPGGQGINVMRQRYETQLGFLLGMVGLILLMACANVANLFTVRAIGRRKEMAVRVSIGATRSDIIRQLLAESLALSLLGGLVATTLGYAIQLGLSHFVKEIHPGLDWRALAFNFALALVTALIFGLVPAIQASNPDLSGTLKEEGTSVSGTTSQGRLRQALALAQLALALTLLTAAGLFARSLNNLEKTDLGFRTDHILTFRLAPTMIGYTPERTQALYRDVKARLEALPGVEHAGMAAALPLSGWNMTTNITIDGYSTAPDEAMDTHINVVSPGYFDAMGIRRLSGRDFEARDSAKAPKVAIVNQTFARKWVKSGNPVGVRMGFGGGSDVKLNLEIVGLVPDQKTDDLRKSPHPFVFIPTDQTEDFLITVFTVRASGDETALGNSVRQVVRAVDANLPIHDMKSMDARKASSVGDDELNSILTGAFGILATILAALGLYAVLAFTVAQTTKEIGIRMALGATEANVVSLVLKGMLRVMLAGLAIGLVGAYATGRWAESLLFGLKGFDPLVILGSVVILAVVALLAAALPAFRASRTDPVTALKRS